MPPFEVAWTSIRSSKCLAAATSAIGPAEGPPSSPSSCGDRVGQAPQVHAEPIRIGFLLLPDFPLMAYAAAVEPLRAANVLVGRTLYRWRHASPDGMPVRASQGFSIVPDLELTDLGTSVDRLFVCAGGNPSNAGNEHLLGQLRRIGRTHGIVLGGISGGPFILARAGLLAGVRCTLHWEHVPAFQETFPDAKVRRSLFEIDRERITCSGGTAALDMMLDLIKRDWGRSLAVDVSDWFLHNQIREGLSPQRLSFAQRFDLRDVRVIRVLEAIEDNLGDPLGRIELARVAGLSVRQLERLFKSTVGCTLHDHALRQRLAHARRLARETAMHREHIALAAGFASTSELRRVERRHSRRGRL